MRGSSLSTSAPSLASVTMGHTPGTVRVAPDNRPGEAFTKHFLIQRKSMRGLRRYTSSNLIFNTDITTNHHVQIKFYLKYGFSCIEHLTKHHNYMFPLKLGLRFLLASIGSIFCIISHFSLISPSYLYSPLSASSVL